MKEFATLPDAIGQAVIEAQNEPSRTTLNNVQWVVFEFGRDEDHYRYACAPLQEYIALAEAVEVARDAGVLFVIADNFHYLRRHCAVEA